MNNILYFSRTMGIGGAENVVMQLCKTQKNNFKKIIVCSTGGERVLELKDLGIKHYNIYDVDNKNPIFITLNFLKLIYILVSEKIDIVHTHHRMAAFYIKVLSFIFKYKHIYTAHNVFNNKKRLTRFTILDIPIIAVGETVKNNLVNYFEIPEVQIHLIYNTTIESSYVQSIESSMQQIHLRKGIIITNVGRLSKQKGQKYFIEAAKNICSEFDDVFFFLVGSGEDEMMLKKLIKELRLEDKVFLLGYRKDVKSLMNQSDIICLSSLWEGLPLVPIEAISLGKVVVATNVGGSCEIIQDYYNGYIVDKTADSEAISDKIKYALEHIESWPNISKNAKKTFDEKFSSNQFICKHQRLYQFVEGE